MDLTLEKKEIKGDKIDDNFFALNCIKVERRSALGGNSIYINDEEMVVGGGWTFSDMKFLYFFINEKLDNFKPVFIDAKYLKVIEDFAQEKSICSQESSRSNFSCDGRGEIFWYKGTRIAKQNEKGVWEIIITHNKFLELVDKENILDINLNGENVRISPHFNERLNKEGYNTKEQILDALKTLLSKSVDIEKLSDLMQDTPRVSFKIFGENINITDPIGLYSNKCDHVI